MAGSSTGSVTGAMAIEPMGGVGALRRDAPGRARLGGRSPSSIHSLRPSTTARSMALRSSRTLPGQACATRAGHRLGAEAAHAPADLLAHPREEVLGEERDVVGALAQRRHDRVDHRQPVVQVLAEQAAPRQVGQVAVGGGDQPHVDR
jgi:hypothetical protein